LTLQPQQTNSASTVSSLATSSEAPTATVAYTTASIVTSTAMTATQSVSTQMTLAPIPGFPWESILAGFLLGMLLLALLRRRRGS
jgi:hypothetical protein